MFSEIVDLLRGEILEEVKSEIHAATIKHMATLLYLANRSGETNDRADEIRYAAKVALEIDAAVEELLEDSI